MVRLAFGELSYNVTVMEILGLIDVPIWLIIIVVLLLALYVYGTSKHDTFSKMGVEGPKPLPILGTLLGTINKGLLQFDHHCFQTYGKVFGLFEGSRTPVLAICDPELVKEIVVKQAAKFQDRRVLFKDELTKDFLTTLEGSDWKYVRNTVSPTFSSGKLKAMIGQINECCKLLEKNLLEEAKSRKDMEIREFTGGYTMDVIASTGFGIQVDSQKDKNNDFVKYAKKAFDFNFSLLLVLLMVFPEARKIFETLGVEIFPRDSLRFFRQVASAVLKQRNESTDKSRTDFIQLMSNSHIEGDETKGVTESQVLAQAVLFFLAGYETTASAITFLMYNLAINPECQEKVLEEVDRVAGKKGEVTFEMLHEMHYLERAINESLRMFPAALRTDRVATEDTVAGDFKINKGMVVAIEIYNLHYDPAVWPEPEKFDPDRFTEEEKAKRSPYSFCPFGVGPRTCIGMRLALLEIKCASIYILRNFRIERSEKTEVPLKFKKMGLLQTENGVWLKLEPRN